jgi:hypothetical protein
MVIISCNGILSLWDNIVTVAMVVVLEEDFNLYMLLC